MTKATVSARSRAERLPTYRVNEERGAIVDILSRSSAEMGEKPHDPPRALAEELGHEETASGPLARLAQGGIGRDHAGDGRKVDTGGDGQAPALNELARMRAEDGGAEHAPVLARQDLDEAVRLALGLGAVVLVKGPAQHLHVAGMGFKRLAL